MPGHPGTPGMRARIPGHSRPDSTVSDIILTVCLQPSRGAVVTLIFTWRVIQRLSVPTIAWRLNRTRPPTRRRGTAPAGPRPGGGRLEEPQVHRAHGLRPDLQALRHQESPARPAQEWIWSVEPAVQADLRRKLDAVIDE